MRDKHVSVTSIGTPAAWVAAGAWAFTVKVFNPGVMSPDSVTQLGQADSWVFATPSPPLMTVLWGILNLVVKGPLLMLVLQAGAWWLGWLLAARLAFPDSRWRQAAAVLVCGFWPPLFAMVGTIWRDVHVTLALLLAAAALASGEPKPRGRRLAGAGLLVAYASAVRVNAVSSVLPFAAWICVRSWQALRERLRPAPRAAAVALCAVAIVFGGRWLNLALASRVWAQQQIVFVFDLVGISARTGTNLLPPAIRNGFERPEQVAALYTAFTTDPVYFGPPVNGVISERRVRSTDDPVLLGEIRQAWWSAVTGHPGAYLDHRAAVFAANLGWNALPLHYPYERKVWPNALGIVQTPSRANSLAYAALDASLRRTPWLWRPWLFLWLSVVVATAAAIRAARGTPARATLFVLSSGILYTLLYFVVAPAADLRFHHWPITASLLGVLLFAAETREARLRGETHPRRALAAFGAFAFATLVLGSAGARSRLDYGPAAPRPADAVRLNSDGLARLARGELAPARQLFERAARTDPTWFVPEINLGLVHRQAGNGDLARAHFDAAVLLDRGAAEARTYRGEFLIGERRWAEALADFEAAIAAGRDTYRNAKGAATAAAALADAGRALRHGNRCQDLEPGRFAVDIVPIANPFFDDEAHARAGVAFFLGLRERLPNAWWVHLNLAALAEKVGDSALASEAAARGAALKGGGR